MVEGVKGGALGPSEALGPPCTRSVPRPSGGPRHAQAQACWPQSWGEAKLSKGSKESSSSCWKKVRAGKGSQCPIPPPSPTASAELLSPWT